MATLGIDTFVRGNQSGWGTASDGELWTLYGGATASIASNEGVLTNLSASNAVALLGGNTTGPINILVRLSGNNFFAAPGVAFRAIDSNNYYRVIVYNGVCNFDKIVSGARSNIAMATVTGWTINQYWWMRAIMVANALTVRIWLAGTSEPGTNIMTASDATYTNGRYGLAAYLDQASNIVSFDSLTVTDNQSNPATVPTLSVVAVFRDGTKTATYRDGQNVASYRDGLTIAGGR